MAARTPRRRSFSGINFQYFVRTTAAAILILSKSEVSGYSHDDEYGPLYQKLNRLHGSRYSSTDDLIEAKPTRSACLTSDDLDCPDSKDTDDLLVPTTRSRSLTDDEMHHRMWSSSPKIKMNKGPEVYESSGNAMTPEEETTPCSSDDEDCLTFSGADELFFPTSDGGVALAVETTSASDASTTTALIVTPTFAASAATKISVVGLSPFPKEEKISSKVFSLARPPHPSNASFTHVLHSSSPHRDASRINFSHSRSPQLPPTHGYGEGGSYYSYGGGVGVGRSLEKLTINIGLILGIAFGIAVLLLVLAFALFKYRNQFGGGTAADKLVDYRASKFPPVAFEPCKVSAQGQGVHGMQPLKVDVSLNLSHHHQHQAQQMQPAVQSASTPRKKDVKEWYV